MWSRPWKKCSPPGTTTTGRFCGRAQSNTAASGTTSSSSPWITRVSAGTVSAGKRFTAGPTNTSRSACTRFITRVCTKLPKEKPASTSGPAPYCACAQAATTTRSSVSPLPSS